MSLYNDIDWSNWKRDEDVCESKADLGATCVEQFRLARGTSVDIQECGTYMHRNRCGSATILDGQMCRVKHCITTMWW